MLMLVWSSYLVQVAAYNVKGPGEYSEEKLVTTGEGKPSQAPTIQNAVAVSPTACEIKWQTPPTPTINGKTQGTIVALTQSTVLVSLFLLYHNCTSIGYHIKAYRGDNTASSANVTVLHNDGSQYQRRITGLMKYTFYR